MRGFVLTNEFEINLHNNNDNNNLLIEKITYGNLHLLRKTINKFLNDKVFFENDSYIIVLEGVILNSKELKEKYKTNCMKDIIIYMYQRYGEKFFSQLEGSFSGVFIDKKKKKILVYTNKIGDKQVFYWRQNNKFIVASDIMDIIAILKAQKIPYSLDQVGSYCLLTHGFMLDDITLISEIKKITAGKYLQIYEGQFEILEYHQFINKPNYNQSEDEIIEKIDDLFLKAVKKQVRKNEEYNYKNIAPLSAGLDARMVNYALDRLNIKNVLNFSYSESEYYDQNIPMKISEELKRHWLFKSLDNGLSLFYLDEVVKFNNGLVLYYGPAQVWDIFRLLDRKEVGVIHTGMLGDVVIGTFFKEKKQNKEASLLDGAYSNVLAKKICESIKENNYDIDFRANQEMFMFYNRGFNGANLGSPLTFQFDCESYSPFYDIEFMEYCLTIPIELRWNHYIYDKWVLKKYPNAAKHMHNGDRKIGEKNNINFFGRETNFKKLPKKVLQKVLIKMSLKKIAMNSKHHMNPLDYWYNNNLELQQYLNQYFTENINILNEESDLKLSCKELYKIGNSIEKIQIVTLLAAVKRLFGEN